MRFEYYKDKKGEWRFRLKARNGRILMASEGYKRRYTMLKTIRKIKRKISEGMFSVLTVEVK